MQKGGSFEISKDGGEAVLIRCKLSDDDSRLEFKPAAIDPISAHAVHFIEGTCFSLFSFSLSLLLSFFFAPLFLPLHPLPLPLAGHDVQGSTADANQKTLRRR